jgi:hypothetical protein
MAANQIISDEEMAKLEATESKSVGFISDEEMSKLESPERSFRAGGEGLVTSDELDAIQKKWNLSPNFRSTLESASHFFGADIQGPKGQRSRDLLKEAGGFAASALLFDVPQKAFIEAQATQEQKEALDELRQLIIGRQSIARTVGEVGVGALVPGLGAAKLAKAVPKLAKAVTPTKAAVASGALSGTATAPRGLEAERAAFGASIGLVGAKAIGLLSKSPTERILAKAPEKLSKAEEKVFPEWKAFEAAEAARDIADEKMLKRRPQIEAAKPILEKADIKSFDKFLETVPEPELNKFYLTLPKIGGDDLAILKKEAKAHGVKGTDVANLVRFRVYSHFDEVLGSVEKNVGKDIQKIRDEEDFLDFLYENKVGENALIEAHSTMGIRNKLPDWGVFGYISKRFSDGKPLVKQIDKRLGTDTESVFEELSQAHNKYTVRIAPLGKVINNLRKETSKAKVDEMDLYHVMDGFQSFKGSDIEKAATRSRVPDDLVKMHRETWEEWRQAAITKGLPIDKRGNYVTYARLRPGTYQAALTKLVRSLESKYDVNLKNLDEDQFTEMFKSPRFRDLVKEVTFLRGMRRGEDKFTAQEFGDKLASSLTDTMQNRAKLDTDAFATKAREGDIPLFVRETNVQHLMARWAQNTFRHGALREGLTKLSKNARVARAAGEDEVAQYLETLKLDLIGSRINSFSSKARNVSNKLLRTSLIKSDEAEEAGNKVAQRYWEGVGYLPEFLNLAGRQVYPNLLGGRIKPILQNLASPLLFSVPEIGYGAGLKVWAEGAKDVVATWTKGITIRLSPEMAAKLGKKAGEKHFTRNTNLVLQNDGIYPVNWTGETLDAFDDGVKRGAAALGFRKVSDTISNVSMAGFQASEAIVRAQSYFMGRRLGTLMSENEKWARKFVEELDSTEYQRKLRPLLDEVRIARKSGRLSRQALAGRKLGKVLTEFFNGNNLFHYDRVHMSEFGRDYGPMVSIFSKWPTSIGGRVITSYHNQGKLKGTKTNLQVLLIPWATIALTEHLIDMEETERSRQVAGRGGVASWTPLSSLIGIGEQGITNTPVAQQISNVVKTLRTMEDPAEGAGRIGKGIYDTFGWGSGALHFLSTEMPVLFGESRPATKSYEDQFDNILRFQKKIERKFK